MGLLTVLCGPPDSLPGPIRSCCKCGGGGDGGWGTCGGNDCVVGSMALAEPLSSSDARPMRDMRPVAIAPPAHHNTLVRAHLRIHFLTVVQLQQKQ